MPEGHSIHRYARLHRQSFAGKQLRVTSPQGRFSSGAARLDRTKLDDVEAHGKHLFYRWSNGEMLHVHLGLFGKFRTFHADPPPPTEGTRMAMEADDATLYLAGPTICRLVSPEEAAEVRARLGPDPLRTDGDRIQFAERLQRRRIPIGAALLDQRVIAGIGNVYRAEILFLTGLSPHRPASRVDEEDAGLLWLTASDQLRRGEKAGRIVTVEPKDVGARRRADIPEGERLYTYKRAGLPCHRCGTAISRDEMANRRIWWCPTCQPR